MAYNSAAEMTRTLSPRRSDSPCSSLRSRLSSLKSRPSKPWLLSPEPSEWSTPPSPVSSTFDEGGYITEATSPSSSHVGFGTGVAADVASWRDDEYLQLNGDVYLDTGGTMLPSRSLIERWSADITHTLLGNPHSSSTPSRRAGRRVEAIRHKALRFFNADPNEWDLVWTANATAAIKLVAECIRDHAAATATPVWYGYHKDSHTSAVGARELLTSHRCFASDDEVDKWISSCGMFGGARSREIGLFSYPAQSNMTGRRLPLSWCGQVRKNIHKARTYTLLDASALLSTAPLDLSDTANAPDFVSLSFYKIFGFPDIGALLVRKASQHVLEGRRYFGGGTVDMVIAVNDSWHVKKGAEIHNRLEEGTLPFVSIIGLDHAIDVHKKLFGPDPMARISAHTSELSRRLHHGLQALKHGNNAPLIKIYSDPGAVPGDPRVQGATVAFNVFTASGAPVGYEDVERAADKHGIYVRSGSLCNPGGMATYLAWNPAEKRAAYASGHRCSQPVQKVKGKPTGVVRASIGAMNTAGDIDRLLDFLARTYLDKAAAGMAQTALPAVARLVDVKPKPVQTPPAVQKVEQRLDALPQHSKRRFGRSVSALLGRRAAPVAA